MKLDEKKIRYNCPKCGTSLSNPIVVGYGNGEDGHDALADQLGEMEPGEKIGYLRN